MREYRLLVMTNISTKKWGIAWVVLVLALGVHVADEALTGFLPLYNSTVVDLRETYSWFPLPTFSFETWLTGLIAVVLFLLLLSPLPFSGNAFFKPVAYFLSVLMMLNGLGHVAVSIVLGQLAPGTLSAPIVFLAAVGLLVTTYRVRSASKHARK